jgi:ABC-type multidrug transport system fused ATPase/permease subunit
LLSALLTGLLALTLLLAALLTIAGALLTLTLLLTLALLSRFLALTLLLSGLVAVAGIAGRLSATGKLFDVPADALGLIESLLHGDLAPVVRVLSLTLSGGRGFELLHLVLQLIEIPGNGSFAHDGVLGHALAEGLLGEVHLVADLGLLGLTHGVAQFLRSIGLRVGHVAGRLLHFLLQLVVLGVHLLFLVRHLPGHGVVFLTLAEVAAEALLKIFLLPGEVFRLAGDVGHFRAGLRVAHVLNHLLGLLQALGGLLGFALPGGRLLALLAGLLGRRRVAHIAGGFFEALDRVIELLLLAAAHRIVAQTLLLGRLLSLLLLLLLALSAVLSGLLSALAALLTLLTLLAGLLSLLALLTLLAALLTLLSVLSGLLALLVAVLHVLHVALQLFGFAAQHFLLPALLG